MNYMYMTMGFLAGLALGVYMMRTQEDKETNFKRGYRFAAESLLSSAGKFRPWNDGYCDYNDFDRGIARAEFDFDRLMQSPEDKPWSDKERRIWRRNHVQKLGLPEMVNLSKGE